MNFNKGNIRGSLRKSQIILGAGPGSIADLKKGSVIISGISKWEDYDKEKDIIHSPKLERLLGVKYFVAPPHRKTIRFEDGSEIKQKDILAYQFPRWGYRNYISLSMNFLVHFLLMNFLHWAIN